MQIITKNNFISVICISYTLISLYMIMVEFLFGEVTDTHFNMLSALVITIIAVLILSLHHKMDFLPPLIMILVQYFLSIGLICGIIWLLSRAMDVHEDAYVDMIVSFTLPYIVGAIIYYVHLTLEIRKQNKRISFIRSNQ